MISRSTSSQPSATPSGATSPEAWTRAGGGVEAAEQIAFADLTVLNKTDLMGAEDLERIEARLRRLNAAAPILRARRAEVDLGALLGRGAFDPARFAELADDRPHGHAAEAGIGSVALSADAPMDTGKLECWLAGLLAEQGEDILRVKSLIQFAGEDRRLAVQAVH